MQYNPSDLEPFLTALPDTKDATPSFTFVFTLDPVTAQPPAEKFAALLDHDYLFKTSWIHARTDLQDQSCSSYDLSLATRAFTAGWNEQEVVNLLIAHRRKYKDRTDNPDKIGRKDYFDRTLSLALAGADQETRTEAVEALKAGKPLPSTMASDPAETMKILSEALKLRITKFVRFRGGSNSYQLEVEGHLIDVPDVEMFDSQMKFRRLLLDYTDKRIAPMKDGAWHEFVNQLFSTIDNVQVSTDATRKGAFENWIDLYLSDSVQSAANWEKAACDNQPFLRDGRTYFVAEGFRLFLYTRFQERMTSQQLTVELTKLGYHYERMNVRTRKGGLTKRSCWRLS